MLLPKPIPWMSQTTSAFLGCILELVFAYVLLLFGRMLVSRAYTVLGAAGGGVCWAHLLVPLVHLHSQISECSLVTSPAWGKREKLCLSGSGFADPSSERGARPLAASCSPELLIQPFVTRGPKLPSRGLGTCPAVMTTIGYVFPGLFQAVWSVTVCILNGCLLHLHT